MYGRVPRLLTILIVCGWTVAAARTLHLQAFGAQQSASGPSEPLLPQSELLNKYCVRCHNDKLKTGGLALDILSTATVGQGADAWEKVVRKLHMGAMPPPGSPRPDKAAVDTFVSSLEAALDAAAARAPNPGRTESLHRLNRAEYQNAVRDLLALDIDTASLLPADDAEGFDNMASLLSISPALMERYMSTARRVSRLAVGLPPSGPLTDTYTVADLALQDDPNQISDDLPFGTRGGLAIHHYFPADAEYLIKVRLRRQIYDYVTGLDREEQLDVRVDGVRVKTFTIGGGNHGRTAPQSFGGDVLGSPEWEKYALTADEGLEVRLPVKAGPRTVGVTFTGRFTVTEGVVQPRERYGEYSRDETRDQAIDSVAITGPYNVVGSAPSDTPSRRRILVCRPNNSAGEETCARKILATLAHRAYRRPVSDQETQTLLEFFKAGRREGTFEAGIQFGLERILADPGFLFRVEQDPPDVAPDTVYRISDLELASRLSFFLWSSLPDDELLDLAERGS